MKKTIIGAFATLLVVSSCYKDKGNYDYTDLGDIRVTGVSASYTRTSLEEKLEITPVIESKNDPAHFEYCWIVYNPSYTESALREPIKVDTISTTKDLSWMVNLTTGTYAAILSVKDPATGYSVRVRFSITAGTRFSEGFYVLKSTPEGNSELDLILNDGTQLTNLFTKSLGSSLKGRPFGLSPLFTYYTKDEGESKATSKIALTAMSDQGLYVMNTSDMSRIFDHKSLFYDSANEPIEQPYYMVSVTSSTIYVSNVGQYGSLSTTSSRGTGKFGIFPSKDPTAQGHTAAPYIYYSTYLGSVLFFDPSNGRFLKANSNGFLSAFADDPTSLYQPNGIEHTILYLGGTRLGDTGDENCYAVFADKTTPSTRYLYTLLFSKGVTNPVQKRFTIPATTKFATATHMTPNRRDARIIYFVSDNKLYYFDPDQNQEYAMTLDDLGANETITYIAHRYWLYTLDEANNFNYFVVATESNGRYKIYFYEMLGGIPQGTAKKILTGEGTVADLEYISPQMGSKSRSYYPV